ncbi:MAG TPA: HAMP domain-containing sensor histidine kinase [Chloroflexia bacterium]|nr:HAMP domain-containing sensor histidine kinase [Chloroflexia bacterium]
MREKIIATHLLVVASSLIALVAVLLLASLIFTPWPPTSVQVVPAFVLLTTVALTGVATAIVAARWLYQQITVPLRRASSLARLLAKGKYPDSMPSNEQIVPTGSDDMDELDSALNDLSVSLQEAERRRTESFDEITHELRTPIAILEGYFEGLLDGHVKPTDKTWAMLYDVASRVHRLVDTLRVLSRAEARREPPDLQSVAPDALARAALDRMRLHFDEKGLELVADIPTGLPHVLADPDYTIQVLVNLLTNALRYTSVPGMVTVAVKLFADTAATDDSEPPEGTSSAPGAREVVFRVTDTGMGIAAEHIPHLFERFFRVDRSSSRATGGSGIGLPVAKALVETMGGRIWAESLGLGKGSSFAFTLLLSADHTPS